jgi:hypothetical protein
MSHGGKREGAGRKPRPDGIAKVPYGTKLESEVVDYLRQCGNAAKTLEDVIKRTKSFRQWKESQNAVHRNP